jgi:hypothetical protein
MVSATVTSSSTTRSVADIVAMVARARPLAQGLKGASFRRA